jgi:hypothetical protein
MNWKMFCLRILTYAVVFVIADRYLTSLAPSWIMIIGSVVLGTIDEVFNIVTKFCEGEIY